MKKIVCFLVLVVVLVFFVGIVVVVIFIVIGGYVQSDVQGVVNKMSGFNLKYCYEQDDNLLGVIGFFIYIEKDCINGVGDYNKGQYYGIIVGLVYCLNDWVSIYGVVGVGYGKFQMIDYLIYKYDISDYGFFYGVGL